MSFRNIFKARFKPMLKKQTQCQRKKSKFEILEMIIMLTMFFNFLVLLSQDFGENKTHVDIGIHCLT